LIISPCKSAGEEAAPAKGAVSMAICGIGMVIAPPLIDDPSVHLQSAIAWISGFELMSNM